MASIISNVGTMTNVTGEPRTPHAAPNANFYSIEPQFPDLVRVKVLKFWARDTMVDFVRDLTQAVQDMSCLPGRYSVLCDVTDSALQSQANCGDFIRLLTDDHAAPERRIAIVTRNPATRMQVRRLIAGQKNAALFENQANAIDWLSARTNNHV